MQFQEKSIATPLLRRRRRRGGGGGVLKAKILEAKYKAKQEFPDWGGGGGCKKNNVQGVWIFSGIPH